MKKMFVVILVAVMVGLFAISAFAQKIQLGHDPNYTSPCPGGDCAKQAWNSADVRQPAPGQVSLRAQTYNNTRPGGNQNWVGVNSVEIRPNLRKNGAQLWYHEDGRWDAQGGKFSLLFPSQAALAAYCASPHPSPAELRAKVAAEQLCPSSIGKGQRWFPF